MPNEDKASEIAQRLRGSAFQHMQRKNATVGE